MKHQPIQISATPDEWIRCVLKDFDSFLLDHASAEKKASGMAMNMISHYPDRIQLVQKMTDLAIEELTHFKEVLKIIHARNLKTKNDQKDPYINRFLACMSKGKGAEHFLIDRLLVAGIIEARGYQRFTLVAENLPDSEPSLKKFYQAISRSEERHAEQFLQLAYDYSETIDIGARCEQLLYEEAQIVSTLPIRAALH